MVSQSAYCLALKSWGVCTGDPREARENVSKKDPSLFTGNRIFTPTTKKVTDFTHLSNNSVQEANFLLSETNFASLWEELGGALKDCIRFCTEVHVY